MFAKKWIIFSTFSVHCYNNYDWQDAIYKQVAFYACYFQCFCNQQALWGRDLRQPLCQ